MPTTQPLQKEVSAAEHPDIPTGTALIGRDTEGRWHYYGSPLTDHTVYVVEDGDVTRHPFADHATVDDWLDHVDDVCGWDVLLYGLDCVELLTIELGRDQEAE